jgi:hypothetical protein
MPLAIAMVVWMMGNSVAPPARDVVRDPDTVDFHVRTTDPLTRAWITHGAEESRTLRDLLSELTASDIIVHVQLVDRIPGGAAGQLFFVTATATARYLRAEIVRGASRADTIALIAHELQHAAEVAAAPRVRDAESLSIFYLGMRDSGSDTRRYDSAAARMTESVVRREVLAHRGQPNDEIELMAQLRQLASGACAAGALGL